jgi:D-serine deaminase-like pyridoxal phosphate-dependent protein
MTTDTSTLAPVVQGYRDQLGRPRGEVTTPALLLDLDKARRNIGRMAALFADLPAALRPHIKVHKSVELARMQIAHGAVGVACATVWEAVVMAQGGVHDVLVANQVTQPDKVAAIAALACDHRVTATVDDVANTRQFAEAAAQSGAELELLIEVDVGMGRCGVRDREALLPIAELIASRTGLRLRGLQAYEGHCSGERDVDRRTALAREANEKAIEAADFLAEHGFPCADISAGGTNTFLVTGANPRITEVQAGSYALLDLFHGELSAAGFEFALTVAGTVISSQGRTVVLDCGRKSVSIDFATPPLPSFPEAVVRYYAEEHCMVDFPGRPPLGLGETTEVVPSYGPTAVNLHDVFHVVEAGIVTDIWPVHPRGPGPVALAPS